MSKKPVKEDFFLRNGKLDVAAHIGALIRYHYGADPCPRGSITTAEAIKAEYVDRSLTAETLRADKAEARVAELVSELDQLGTEGLARLNAWRDIEAQLSALRTSLEPLVEAVEDLTPLKFTQYPALAKVMDWLRGPARSFVRGERG